MDPWLGELLVGETLVGDLGDRTLANGAQPLRLMAGYMSILHRRDLMRAGTVALSPLHAALRYFGSNSARKIRINILYYITIYGRLSDRFCHCAVRNQGYVDAEGDAANIRIAPMKPLNTKLVLSALGIVAMLTSPAFAKIRNAIKSSPPS